jgi:hypothetical protein
MPRKPPPPGFITAAQAAEMLQVSDAMLSKYVKQGKLERHVIPGRQHGYYERSQVLEIVNAERAFYKAAMKKAAMNKDSFMDAVFKVATPDDMDALYAMAVRLFPHTADAQRRRSWMEVESRGHYIVRRESDKAVVAYCYFLSFKPEYLAEYLHDDLPSRKIEPGHIEPIIPGRPVTACALAGIGSDPDIDQETRSNYVAILLRGIRKDLERLGREGVVIPNLYAFSETNAGIAMCMRLGMKEWEPPKGKRFTFQMEVETSRSFLLRPYKQALAEWRRSH